MPPKHPRRTLKEIAEYNIKERLNEECLNILKKVKLNTEYLHNLYSKINIMESNNMIQDYHNDLLKNNNDN